MTNIVTLTPNAENVWNQVLAQYQALPGTRWGWCTPGLIDNFLRDFCTHIQRENDPTPGVTVIRL